MRWLVVMVVACGAVPAPPPPPKPIVVAPAPPAPVTCGDAGVILRGRVADERDAGPMKEAAIARACLHDKWPAEVLACTGGPDARSCLDKLTAAQRKRYRERIARWNDAFPDEELDDETLENLPDFVDCENAVGDASQYSPLLTQTGEVRELVIALRRKQLLALCEDWSTEARRCFQDIKLPARCRTRLEPDQQQALIDRLDEIDAVFAKVAATKPPACKQLVAAHYADARWKGKLEPLAPADRRKVIAASRSAMVKACRAENWSATVRSCVAADAGNACFVTQGAWGFPPSAIPIKTGIPECDAYGDALRVLVQCTQIPKSAVQVMLDAHQQNAANYVNTGPVERVAAARSCAQQDSAIRQSARSLGCTI